MAIYKVDFQNFNDDSIDAIGLVNPVYLDDISNIIDNSGLYEDFYNLLTQRLKFLKSRERLCILKPKWFEALKHDKNRRLYSLKLSSIKNIRILFVFYSNYKNPIMLCAFCEKSKKDYKLNIAKANNTIAILAENGLLNEEEILCHNQ